MIAAARRERVTRRAPRVSCASICGPYEQRDRNRLGPRPAKPLRPASSPGSPELAEVRGGERGRVRRARCEWDGIMHLTKQGANRENPARVLSAFTACRLAG